MYLGKSSFESPYNVYDPQLWNPVRSKTGVVSVQPSRLFRKAVDRMKRRYEAGWSVKIATMRDMSDRIYWSRPDGKWGKPFDPLETAIYCAIGGWPPRIPRPFSFH